MDDKLIEREKSKEIIIEVSKENSNLLIIMGPSGVGKVSLIWMKYTSFFN